MKVFSFSTCLIFELGISHQCLHSDLKRPRTIPRNHSYHLYQVVFILYFIELADKYPVTIIRLFFALSASKRPFLLIFGLVIWSILIYYKFSAPIVIIQWQIVEDNM